MKHLLRPALGAVLVLVVAACADPSGQSWTPPPAGTPAVETAAPESAAPASAAPGSPAPATAAPASVAPSAAPSAPASVVPGEARVIELEMDAALQIKQDGQKVVDIPVTPGETITFRIDNTAGYAHNFWIGTDQQLMTNQVQGLPGLPDWSSGVQEFTWVVPDDITGLKYGCTVPGHYSLMQGTFSVAA
jgi:uncharacterized cupredoxin-like copper-binding protein